MLNEVLRSLDNAFRLNQVLDDRNDFDIFAGSHVSGNDPAINLFTRGDDLVAVIEMPGVEKEELNIEIKNNVLHVAGKRKLEYSGDDITVHRLERDSFEFDRSIKLPFAVAADQAKANYEDGVIRIELTKSETEKPRRINVE